MALSLNMEKLGTLLTGWVKKGGQAAEYKQSGSDYRTYRPAVAPTPGGGLFVTTKIDHIRGAFLWVFDGKDDHAQLDLTMNAEGRIRTHRVLMQIQGSPKFDTGLVTEAAALSGAKEAAIANVSARILNSLSGHITHLREHGGRAAFPGVVQLNLLHILNCVEGAAEAPQPGPAEAPQAGWRWCRNCQGLFFAGNPTLGACPAGGQHAQEGSGAYLIHKPGPGRQPGWRWCRNCQGLFFAGNPTLGACPAGGQHTQEGSGEYGLDHDGQGPGQEGWRWCRNCQGLFFAEAGTLGACPAGGQHTQEGSGLYRVPHT